MKTIGAVTSLVVIASVFLVGASVFATKPVATIGNVNPLLDLPGPLAQHLFRRRVKQSKTRFRMPSGEPSVMSAATGHSG
jgi:hypothetical protein